MTVRAILLLGCKRGLLVGLAALLCFAATVSQATEPRIERIEPLVTEGQLTLDLDLTLELGRVVIEAAERGVPLYFTFDLKITSPRWWWFDRVLVETALTRRLTYNALTQQWRVATGDLFLPVGSLNEALAVLKQVRGWPVAPSDRFDKNQRYDGRIRMRLDASQLARPLQLEAANRSAWSLASPWAPFDFSIQQAGLAK
ncbi:MAG: DUF4390 domain-containing protein [Alcaligenaceae bacterium]